jgi:hypothetical protein
MTTLPPNLQRIGDQLDRAWRPARPTHSRRRALLGAALVTLLALTAAAVAGEVLPFSLAGSSDKPTRAELAQLRAVYQPPKTATTSWRGAPRLELSKALVIARMATRRTGPLSLIVVPGVDSVLCLDAARPDGSSQTAGCATAMAGNAAMRRMYHARYNFFAGIPGAVHNHTEEDAFAIWIRDAPPRAARVDVRSPTGTRLPAVISHGWIVYVIPDPRHNLAQVSVFDAAGKRLFSYFSP